MNIVELGRTEEITYRLNPYRRFVRKVVLGPYSVDSDILSVSGDLDESDRASITVIGVSDSASAQYVRQVSLAGVTDEQQSYYWDSTEQALYIHIPPSINPFTEVFFFGLAQGFTDSQVIYIDDQLFTPLVEGTPSVRQQQDIENYDKLSFITGSITLSNEDGRLDELRLQPVYGNNVVMHHLPDELDTYTRDDLTRLASLFVADYDISLQQVSLRIQDLRKSQNADVPSARFNSTDYPNADDSLYGEVIPVVWGSPREIPALIMNEELDDDTANVEYRAALTLTSLGTVYVDDDDEWVDVTANVTNTNLATGEFELPAANGRDSNGNPLEAKLVGAEGISITRLTDIIKDANDRFLGIGYTDANYDTDEWETEETDIATGGLYLDEEIKLFELIRKVQNGANVGFRYEIKPDGRRTIRVDDEDRARSHFVQNVLIANRDSLDIKTNSELLAAEVVVKYGESYVSDRWLRLVDDSKSGEVQETYRQRPRKTIETLLTSETHAQERADFVLERFDEIRGIGEFELMGADFLTLRIYDIIDIEITPDEPTNMERPFYGTWRCKVIAVEPDARRVANKIEAVLIEEL